MHFEAPQYLWLLWLLPPLGLLWMLAAARRKAALQRFAAEELAEQLLPDRSPSREVLRAVLLGGAIVAVVACLAGPRWGFEWEQVERRGVDIVVALDLSRSMLAEDVAPDRLTAAKREIMDLLDLLEGDRVGLVVFAGTAFTQCPLTLDYGAFGVFLDQLDPNWVPIGGTDLAAAVRTSMQTFIPEDRSGRAILLITDGEDHGGELQAAAEEARAEGVHVFVVGIGAPEGVPVPDGQGGFIEQRGEFVLSKLDEPALKELALTTGGSYERSVAGVADLESIYKGDIKTRLEARALTSSRQKRWEERYQWFALMAFGLLFLEPLLGPRRRGFRLRRAPKGGVAVLIVAGSLLGSSPAQAGLLFGNDPLRQGHAAFDEGDYQEALDHWLQAQAAEPNDRRIDYNIGSAYYRLGSFPEAEQAFRAAAASPDRDLGADALHNTGNALVQQGRYPEAIAAYEQALEVRPGDEDSTINRDIAQRLYEEALEQAQEDAEQQQQQEQQEQEQDASTDQQEPGEEGEDGEQQQQQEQQQGQGRSEQQPEQPPEESGRNPQENPDQDSQEQPKPEGSDDGEAKEDEQEQRQVGGKAAAAEIDREEAEGAQEPTEGEIAHQTEEDPSADDRPAAVIEGALSEEQAESLLRALEADQDARRQERTRREAGRGRRSAAKDW